MKQQIYNFLVRLLLATVLVSGVTACSNADFEKSVDATKNNGFDIPEDEIDKIPDVNDPECSGEQVCLVIRDNFERPVLTESEFYWSQFLDDKGRSLNGLDIKIRDDVPASSGESALYFTGRPGNSVHSLYLISKVFDLTGFTKVTIEFDYILASFESYNDNGDSGNEFLRVDLCSKGAKNCGVGISKSEASQRLKDDNLWLSLYSEFAISPINQQLTGLNHTISDYVKIRSKKVAFNLDSSGVDQSKVMLRWNVKLTDGIDSLDSEAGIVDNIVVRAYR